MIALDRNSYAYQAGELTHHVRSLIEEAERLAAERGVFLDPDCGLGLSARMARETLQRHEAIDQSLGVEVSP